MASMQRADEVVSLLVWMLRNTDNTPSHFQSRGEAERHCGLLKTIVGSDAGCAGAQTGVPCLLNPMQQMQKWDALHFESA